MLFVEPLGGGAGAALDRRSFFVLEPSQGVTSPPRAPLMCRTLLGWLLPLLTVSLAVSGTRSFAQDAPKASSSSAGISEVIAEGAGATPDEALKDAFRNAVRQVVGAVVDAETLIKNDEVIDDQILTYSDGFVKKFDEVAGSKKSVGGLHRVKIKAQVERRSVIAKLKSAKVTVKDVDGKSLFAEAVTSAEAEANSTKLLAKALSDLPKLLTASVSGKPEYDREKGEVVLNIDVEVDAKAYREFAARLNETLRKMAISTTTALVKAEAYDTRRGFRRDHADVVGLHIADRPNSLLGPMVPKEKGTQWCFWVCNSNSGNQLSQRWNGYVIDADILATALPLQNRHPDRITNPQWYRGLNLTEMRAMVQIELRHDESSAIAEDEFELIRGDEPVEGSHRYRLPWLISVVPRGRTQPKVPYDSFTDSLRYFCDGPGSEQVRAMYVPNVYVAPLALDFAKNPNFGAAFDLEFVTKQLYQRRIKLTLDELKQVKDLKCSVVYSPAAK